MADKRKKNSPEKHRQFNVKRNRMEGEENAEPAIRKTIVDIDNDCLKYLFGFLEFRDLINVAEANVHIKVAAEAVFARKLKRRLIIVEIDPELERFRCPDMGIYDDAISIHTPLLAFRAIRNFGPRIKGIHLKIKTNDFLREKFFLHVSKYCNKTLDTLLIWGDHSSIFGAVEHPFENVEQFSSCNGVVGAGCEQLNRLFPRLRQLKFIDNDILDLKSIAHTYPNLESFAFNYEFEFPNNFIDSDLITITTLNPQIQYFELISYHKPRIWELISTQLQSLKSIRASYYLEHARCFIGSPILFNNIEIFDVTSYYGLSAVSPIDVFSFKQLKTLTVKCWYEEPEIWLDFVLEHPTIDRLEICIVEVTLWFMYQEMFKQIRRKLNLVRQNTKFISLQLNCFTFYDPSDSGNTLKLLKFLAAQKWFNKVTVMFELPRRRGTNNFFKELSAMEVFTTKISQICGRTSKLKSFMKIYKIKKYILSDIPYVDFEKCEQ